MRETVLKKSNKKSHYEPPVTISIACFNKLEYTKQCLINLYNHTSTDLFSLVIVNNASKDGTYEWLKDKLPEIIPFNKNSITIINNQINEGFAKAHNRAFQECKTKYFLPLNNDTLPLKKWLEPLVTDLENDKKAAIVGPKLISPLLNGIQSCGTEFAGAMPYHRFFAAPPDMPLANKREYVAAITGACMMIRSKIFKEFKGFDDRFINGWEDVDLDLKIREAGWKIIYEPTSVLYHYEGQTQGRFDNDDQNRDLFTKLWGRKLLQGLGAVK